MARREKLNPEDNIKKNIARLCTQIGDRTFTIKEAESEINRFCAQIRQLRDELQVLEGQSGPQNIK